MTHKTTGNIIKWVLYNIAIIFTFLVSCVKIFMTNIKYKTQDNGKRTGTQAT